ncbi:meiotic cell cortex C-terminal pleckstrin homology-domain-containing protein [Phyllosticta capitalensis]|uniref:meiotic cell cortex C-terminal pleckstrin homology-domain-containing protein n=1 Tax=Phyllosticta capitalensis TaxID=121624 RepID=UPI00312E2A27
MASGNSSDHEFKAPPSRQTSSETIFMTPQPSSPARSSRHGTPSTPGDPESSPPPLHSESSPDSLGDNSFSFDPRRLTPTLQANLVAEILNLRREIDSKNRIIEDLETSLESSQNETQDLHERLSASQSENRAAKRHVKTLESDTFTTLEELAHERDEAKAETEMLRNRLEDSRRKAKNEGEVSDRTQDLWQKDKDAWDAEKRSMERRIHVSETRLKAVLEELAAQQAAAQECFEAETDENIRDSGFAMESDGVSLPSQSLSNSPKRTLSHRSRHERNHSGGSMRSFRRNRASVLTVGSELQQKLSGPSLADELALDEEDEEEEIEEEAENDDGLDSEDYSENELRARRALELRQSQLPDGKARKMLGLETDGKMATSEHESDTKENKQSAENASSHRRSLERPATAKSKEVPQPKHDYVDTGVQPSPPPSPKLAPQVMAAARNSGHIVSAMVNLETNQRKKPISDQHTGSEISHHKTRPMVSSSCQTLNHPPSPPETPTVMFHQSPVASSPSTNSRPKMTSASTQTQMKVSETSNLDVPPTPTRAPPPATISVPQITIEPPGSCPTSPSRAVLPPGTKSVSSQTTPDMFPDVCSRAMQTDPIMVTRLGKLPAHLLPSSIASSFTSPDKKDSTETKPVLAKPFEEKGKSPLRATQAAQAALKSMRHKSIEATEDKYPGHNDDGPLTTESTDGIRRPFRSSSLFAGFDEEAIADESDDDHRKEPSTYDRMMKYHPRLAKPPTPVPEEKEPPSRPRSSCSAKVEKSPSIRRQSSQRRSNMSPTRVSQGLGESSKLASARPPFPVPIRSSSRKVPLSRSEGSQSPPIRNNMLANRRSRKDSTARQDSLRKVRSAAVIRRSDRFQGRSPPPPKTSLTSPTGSQTQSPIGQDRVSTPKQSRSEGRGHKSQNSRSTPVPDSKSSPDSLSQSISVVDAIAITMVGEWMWKYVRGRKSFGVADAVSPDFKDDGTGNAGINGVRHKRWVWISPYERSILWSSKQPTNNAGLMGKPGRKLVVQSVLDVKDDGPPPKGSGSQPVFNRSILVLTPARALKFTAMSAERHYIWLTALSFLAHSSQSLPDLSKLPTPTPQPPEPSKKRLGPLTTRKSSSSIRATKEAQASKQPSQTESPREGQAAQSPASEGFSPPAIPRYHGRKRSVSSPRQTAFRTPMPHHFFGRSFSSNQASANVPPVPAIPKAIQSSTTPSAGTSEVQSPTSPNVPPSVPSSIYNPSASRRTSASSSAATHSTQRREFFDAVAGMMRMEAFVETQRNDSKHSDSGYSDLRISASSRNLAAKQMRSSSASHRAASMTNSRAPTSASTRSPTVEHGGDFFKEF